MRLVLQTLLDELNRLKISGESNVTVSEQSLNALKHAVDTIVLAEHGDSSRVDSIASPASLPVVDELPTSPPNRNAPPGANALTDFLEGKGTTSAAAPKTGTGTGPLPRRLPSPPDFILSEGSKQKRWEFLSGLITNDQVRKVNSNSERPPLLDSSNLNPLVLFLGDHASPDEEKAGEPFSDPPGLLLQKIIQAMGLKREQVHLAYTLPWRPLSPASTPEEPLPRDPTHEELAYVLPYVHAMIEVLQPLVVVALGANAARCLLGANSFKTLSEIKGQWKETKGLPLMISYHPNYLKIKESESKIAEKKAKRAAWEDMLKVMDKANLPISDKQRTFFT